MPEPRILVVNHAHSIVCGIHDLGVRIFERLAEAGVQAGYAECVDRQDFINAVIKTDPSHVIVNHRDDLTPWAVGACPTATLIAVAHQYGPHSFDTLVEHLTRGLGFDRVLALDPTVDDSDPRVIRTTRPLPPWHPNGHVRVFPPRIGTFGFAFPHKRFDLVAAQAATLERATLVVHAPEAFFNGANGAPVYGPGMYQACLAELDPAQHSMVWTEGHVPPVDVVELLAANTVNCLLYEPGQPDAGLSSALDYLVAAGRPMLLSEATMFHHAAGSAAWYPTVRLGDMLGATYSVWEAGVQALRAEWTEHFAPMIVEAL